MTDLKSNLLDYLDPSLDEDFTSPPKQDETNDDIQQETESQKAEDRPEEEIVGTKRLIPGKTLIGHISGKVDGQYRDFDVYYGNILDPIVNNNPEPLKEEIYLDILQKFIDSDEGLDYIVPTDAEIRQSQLEMLTFMDKIKEQYAPKNISPEPVVQDIKEDEKDILQEEDIDKVIESTITEDDNNFDEVVEEEIEPIKIAGQNLSHHNRFNFKVLAIVFASLLALSVIGNVMQFLSRPKAAELNPDKFAELNVNGEVYQIPFADLSVEDNETKLILYGISVSKINGETQHKAIPLGEFNFNGLTFEALKDANGNNVNVVPGQNTETQENTQESTSEIDDTEKQDNTETVPDDNPEETPES